jgi:hypothetical protein
MHQTSKALYHNVLNEVLEHGIVCNIQISKGKKLYSLSKARGLNNYPSLIKYFEVLRNLLKR